jgi:hypothetical protein
MSCSEGSPHPGCVFFEVAGEAKVTGFNSAGKNRNYCQIVLAPFGHLIGLIDLYEDVEDVSQAKMYTEHKDPGQVVGFRAGSLERGDTWGL